MLIQSDGVLVYVRGQTAPFHDDALRAYKRVLSGLKKAPAENKEVKTPLPLELFSEVWPLALMNGDVHYAMSDKTRAQIYCACLSAAIMRKVESNPNICAAASLVKHTLTHLRPAMVAEVIARGVPPVHNMYTAVYDTTVEKWTVLGKDGKLIDQPASMTLTLIKKVVAKDATPLDVGAAYDAAPKNRTE